MRRFIVVVTLALSAVEAGANDEDAKLAKFFKSYLDEEFKHRPLEATRLGDSRFDDELDDFFPKARAAGTDRARQALTALATQIDAKKLSRSGQIDLEIFRHNLTRGIWLDENLDRYVSDPRVYNEIISDAIYLPLTQSTRPKEAIVKSVLSRMTKLSKVVAAARESLDSAKTPKVYVDTALRQNQGAIRFYESGLFDLIGPTKEEAKLRAAAKEVVKALREHQDFLEKELLPKAKGEWRIGKEK